MIRIVENPFTAAHNQLICVHPTDAAVTPNVVRLDSRWLPPVVVDPLLYTRTLVGHAGSDALEEDLEARSSWTHARQFVESTNAPMIQKYSTQWLEFATAHDIYCGDGLQYELLKYEAGDFFSKHRDTVVNRKHAFTCLLFWPTEAGFVGGDLVFSNASGSFQATVHASQFTVPTMVIFSVDLYHEITPVTAGTRYVFKTPLFTLYENRAQSILGVDVCGRDLTWEVDELCDGGHGFGQGQGGGDY
jgi:predicted 2-oxoglutarate/Fe(II)-dependent dioxygenase YbiX